MTSLFDCPAANELALVVEEEQAWQRTQIRRQLRFTRGAAVASEPHKLAVPSSTLGPATFRHVDSENPPCAGTLHQEGAETRHGVSFPQTPTAPVKPFPAPHISSVVPAAGAASGGIDLLCPWCLFERGQGVVRSQLVRVQSCPRHTGEIT
jgi:hypothetical protein